MQQMTLTELRKARGVTQTEVAERMGWNQSRVSRLEHQRDALVSTVAAYIAALDGALVVGAAFADDNAYVRLLF